MNSIYLDYEPYNLNLELIYKNLIYDPSYSLGIT
jgi:hypothetical protein